MFINVNLRLLLKQVSFSNDNLDVVQDLSRSAPHNIVSILACRIHVCEEFLYQMLEIFQFNKTSLSQLLKDVVKFVNYYLQFYKENTKRSKNLFEYS